MIATPAPLHYQNLHADIERCVAIVLGALLRIVGTTDTSIRSTPGRLQYTETTSRHPEQAEQALGLLVARLAAKEHLGVRLELHARVGARLPVARVSVLAAEHLWAEGELLRRLQHPRLHALVDYYYFSARRRRRSVAPEAAEHATTDGPTQAGHPRPPLNHCIGFVLRNDAQERVGAISRRAPPHAENQDTYR